MIEKNDPEGFGTNNVIGWFQAACQDVTDDLSMSPRGQPKWVGAEGNYIYLIGLEGDSVEFDVTQCDVEDSCLHDVENSSTVETTDSVGESCDNLSTLDDIVDHDSANEQADDSGATCRQRRDDTNESASTAVTRAGTSLESGTPPGLTSITLSSSHQALRIISTGIVLTVGGILLLVGMWPWEAVPGILTLVLGVFLIVFVGFSTARIVRMVKCPKCGSFAFLFRGKVSCPECQKEPHNR